MVSSKTKRDFMNHVVNPDSLYEEAIDWISTYLSPEEVFKDEVLKQWAETHGYVLESEARLTCPEVK